MDAWSADPVQPQYLRGRTPLELRGAVVFQEKQCRNCHAVGGMGGQRGPELTDVATRLTEDQLIRQVLQGGGNMPAYGKSLSPSQITALVSFLDTLHPHNQPEAKNSAEHSTAAIPGEPGTKDTVTTKATSPPQTAGAATGN